MDAKTIGDKGEAFVAKRLKEKGYQILEKNFTSPYGEIDIIAKKGETLSFVEVKTRRYGSLVSGEASVTKRKQKRIISTALLYLQEFPQDNLELRFDVAVVCYNNIKQLACEYYKAAFDMSAYA